ncbi:ABC transporter permease [Fusibacter paucivorans]|jgi:peptide/nickel transport system permease protein|uniref:ABC transporter permease n=1 Tax=Fusibacter paucivorans TaxID=76009 RepID=A0ABS5PK11_9FIRM|nr:ABC transporter permease [Fusibacter paucivorans]MBS7525434.1 ABC transporter permease [Fusibacter paucivorans]
MKENQFIKQFLKNKMGVVGFSMLVIFILIALFGPMIVQYDPQVFGERADVLNPPSAAHWLGTDDLGRDVFKALIAGSRVSLIVGVAATFISMFIGTSVGIFSGYLGGKTDNVLMRITDVFLVLPWLPLMLVLAALLGSNIWNIIFVIGITGWAGTARIVRAQTLTEKERQYIERSKSFGASNLFIIWHHIFPNVFPLVFANTILVTATSILSETTLSFLGMGDVSKPSWGTTLHFAFESGALSNKAYWYFMPPGVCVLLLVLAFTLMGFALDEIVNPKLRQR